MSTGGRVVLVSSFVLGLAWPGVAAAQAAPAPPAAQAAPAPPAAQAAPAPPPRAVRALGLRDIEPVSALSLSYASGDSAGTDYEDSATALELRGELAIASRFKLTLSVPLVWVRSEINDFEDGLVVSETFGHGHIGVGGRVLHTAGAWRLAAGVDVTFGGEKDASAPYLTGEVVDYQHDERTALHALPFASAWLTGGAGSLGVQLGALTWLGDDSGAVTDARLGVGLRLGPWVDLLGTLQTLIGGGGAFTLQGGLRVHVASLELTGSLHVTTITDVASGGVLELRGRLPSL